MTASGKDGKKEKKKEYERYYFQYVQIRSELVL